MKFTNNPYIRFIFDLSTLIANIIFIAPGFYLLYHNFKNKPRLVILLIFLLIIVFLFLFYRFKKSISFFINKSQEEGIKKEIEIINARKGEIGNIWDYIPTNKQLIKWLRFSHKKARLWANDALFLGVHFNIYFGESYKSIGSLSFKFHSDFKQADLSLLLTKEGTEESYEEPFPEMHVQNDTKGDSHFLKGFSKWRKALDLSIKKLSERIGENYTLGISINSENATFFYIYQIGKLNTQDYFFFDGNSLRRSRDKETIPVN